MRKLLFALMAVAAITLTSCLGKTETPGQGDPQAEAPENATDIAGALGEQLKAGDGNKFFALLSSIQEKAIGFVKDNPEKAKEYLGTAQKFIADNKEKITELLGKVTNSDLAERAQGLIQSISEQPVDQLLGIMGVASDAAGDAVDAVGDKVDELKDAAGSQVDALKDAAGEAVDKVAGDAKEAVGNILGN